MTIDKGNIHHGTTYGYRKGCRCGACTEAKKLDWQEYKARQASHQVNPFEDFEGQNGEADQVAAILKDLVLRVRCDCGEWHEASPDFQCPSGALALIDFDDHNTQ